MFFILFFFRGKLLISRKIKFKDLLYYVLSQWKLVSVVAGRLQDILRLYFPNSKASVFFPKLYFSKDVLLKFFKLTKSRTFLWLTKQRPSKKWSFRANCCFFTQSLVSWQGWTLQFHFLLNFSHFNLLLWMTRSSVRSIIKYFKLPDVAW